MRKMRQGDLVVRKSYGGDITFFIQHIDGQQAQLKGLEFRLLADSPVSDLDPADPERIMRSAEEERRNVIRSVRQFDRFRKQQAVIHHMDPHTRSGVSGKAGRSRFFEMPGKVLHLDGDYNYLRKSMLLYKELRVPAVGYYVPEPGMSEALYRLLPRVNPDIVVLTGHDGILKTRKVKDIQSLDSYKNSQNFASAVLTARRFDRNRDNLIVIAGACQSHFEALLKAGANFASSPGRVLIHALDPLYIASQVSFTSIKDTVQISDVLHHTMSGLDGLGGVETRGSYRIGLPHVSWESSAEAKVR